MSHFPIHHASIAANPTASAAHFLGEAGEATIGGCPAPPPARDADGREVDGRPFVPAGAGERTVAPWAAQARWHLEPLLPNYWVDVYDAGTHLDLHPPPLCPPLLPPLLPPTPALPPARLPAPGDPHVHVRDPRAVLLGYGRPNCIFIDSL